MMRTKIEKKKIKVTVESDSFHSFQKGKVMFNLQYWIEKKTIVYLGNV